jgi:hypothetical protein
MVKKLDFPIFMNDQPQFRYARMSGEKAKAGQ